MGIARLVKNNLSYIRSDLAGFASAYSLATPTTMLLSHCGVSDEVNVIGTFVAKSLGFAAGKILTHDNYRLALTKSNILSTGLDAILQMACHYFVLKSHVLPVYLSHFASYALTGSTTTGFRWFLDYRSGVFDIENKADR